MRNFRVSRGQLKDTLKTRTEGRPRWGRVVIYIALHEFSEGWFWWVSEMQENAWIFLQESAMVWLRNFLLLTESLIHSTSLHPTCLLIPAAGHLVLFLSSDKDDKLKISLDMTSNISQGHNETKQLHLYQTQDENDSSDKTNLVLQTHLFTLGKLFELHIPVCSGWIRRQEGKVIRRQ